MQLTSIFSFKQLPKIFFTSLIFITVSLSVYSREIPLRWEKGNDIDHYIVEIAKDRQFLNIIKTYKAKEHFIKIELKSGLFYLRVSAISKQGIRGYFSDIRVIEIKPKKKPPPPRVGGLAKRFEKGAKTKRTRRTTAVRGKEKPEEEEEDIEKELVYVDEEKELVFKPEKKKATKKNKIRLKGIMSRRARWNPISRMWVPAD